VEWNFVSFMWAMLIFSFWFSVIWVVISVLMDVFRRSMSGWAKAAWTMLIVFLPLIGSIAYLIARPRDAESGGLALSNGKSRAGYHAADEIRAAGQLYDQGRITSDEYERLKSKALAR
jgi:CBS domain containing-hemolysin-like protein